MTWSEICIQTTQEAIEAVAHILHEAGASGVVIEDPEVLQRDFSENTYGELYQLDPQDYPVEGVFVKGYVLTNDSLASIVEEVTQAIAQLSSFGLDVGSGELSVVEVKEDDWAHAWKKYYKPARITEQITITPSWEVYQPEEEQEIIVQLDPGMAFGTGTHPTTALAITMLERVLKDEQTVIDVGCGSGVLSIVAAKLGAGEILALDLDEVAIKVTQENIEENGVASLIRVKQNNLLDQIEQKADIIVANILAEVILRFVADAERLLNPGGYFLTSGIIASKQGEVEEALRSHNFLIEETLFEGDWVAFSAKKMYDMRD